MKALTYIRRRGVSSKEVDDARIRRPTVKASDVYRQFDRRVEGWTKVVRHPAA